MQIIPHQWHLVEVQVLGKMDHRNNGQMETQEQGGLDFQNVMVAFI